MDKTSQKALRMLEMLCLTGEPRGVSELARELGLPKSNIHRLLTTLEAEGYIRQTPEKTYVLTFKLWELGLAMISRIDVRAVAPVHMRELVDKTGESALLAVLDGFDVVYVDKVESRQAIQATTKIGSRIPAHCVGTGKAILAAQPESYLKELLRTARSYTANTIHREPAFSRQLQETRERGYSINHGEFREGVSGVGAAILDAQGSPIAAIGVWGPGERIAPQQDELGKQTMLTAQSISRELGWTGTAAKVVARKTTSKSGKVNN